MVVPQPSVRPHLPEPSSTILADESRSPIPSRLASSGTSTSRSEFRSQTARVGPSVRRVEGSRCDPTSSCSARTSRTRICARCRGHRTFRAGRAREAPLDAEIPASAKRNPVADRGALYPINRDRPHLQSTPVRSLRRPRAQSRRGRGQADDRARRTPATGVTPGALHWSIPTARLGWAWCVRRVGIVAYRRWIPRATASGSQNRIATGTSTRAGARSSSRWTARVRQRFPSARRSGAAAPSCDPPTSVSGFSTLRQLRGRRDRLRASRSLRLLTTASRCGF